MNVILLPPQPGHIKRDSMQVVVLILLGSYLVDKWLLEICFDVVGERATAAQELAIELLCGLGEPLSNAGLPCAYKYLSLPLSLSFYRGTYVNQELAIELLCGLGKPVSHAGPPHPCKDTPGAGHRAALGSR